MLKEYSEGLFGAVKTVLLEGTQSGTGATGAARIVRGVLAVLALPAHGVLDPDRLVSGMGEAIDNHSGPAPIAASGGFAVATPRVFR